MPSEVTHGRNKGEDLLFLFLIWLPRLFHLPLDRGFTILAIRKAFSSGRSMYFDDREDDRPHVADRMNSRDASRQCP
jgi:hypothetical protein